MKPTIRLRTLRIESLERREVLAGNVTAAVSNGQLLITGNYQDNALVVYQGQAAGQVVVAGVKDAAGGNTLINGSVAPVTLSGVNRVYLDLRGGNDRVLVTNLALPTPPSGQRSVTADLGDGNDQIVFSGDTGAPRAFALNSAAPITYGPVVLGGTAYTLGRGGNDTMSVANASFGGGQQSDGTIRRSGFDAGDGNDQFLVDGSLSQNHIDELQLNMGVGNDTVSIKRLNIDNSLIIKDDDSSSSNLGTSRIDLYKCKINYALDVNVFARQASFTIDSDATSPFYVGKGSIISLYFQPSEVTIRHADFRSLDVRTSYDQDTVEITDSIFRLIDQSTDSLNVTLAGANDTLKLQNVVSKGSTTLGGGPGTDTYVNQGGNSLGDVTFYDFES